MDLGLHHHPPNGVETLPQRDEVVAPLGDERDLAAAEVPGGVVEDGEDALEAGGGDVEAAEGIAMVGVEAGRDEDGPGLEVLERGHDLRRHARLLTGQAARADDLVQDTVERACRKWALFSPRGAMPAALLAWLLTLLVLIISIFSHLIKGLDYEEAILAAALAGWLWLVAGAASAPAAPPVMPQST